jgi:hypothetical protein
MFIMAKTLKLIAMRMNVKLFTLKMSLPKAEERSRNSIAIRDNECCIPDFTEDDSEPRYLSSNRTVSQAEP